MNDDSQSLDAGQGYGNVVADAVKPYASARRRATVVCALFLLGILVEAILLWLTGDELQILSRVGQGDVIAEQQLDTNYAWQFVLALGWIIVWIAQVVAFLMWVHRAHRNLPALRATGMKFTPGWAVGWYFIPYLNLFKPYQVMREICNASAPADAPNGGDAWHAYPAPFVVKLWWTTFLFMCFANSIFQQTPQPEEIADYQIVAVASIVVIGLAFAASLAALWLVRSVTGRQEERAQIIGRTQPSADQHGAPAI